MNDGILVRILGGFAIIGGGLRIVSSFEPWQVSPLLLEFLYSGTDVALLFGLMGIYFAVSEQLGFLGLLTFIVAEAGIASIVGPDTTAFGVDTYQAGVMAISLGLCAMGLLMFFLRVGSALAALCWIASTLVGVAGFYAGEQGLGFFIGGLLFGLGFVVGGAALFSSATPN